MASLNRIVLLSTWGDEMFSGKSLLSEAPDAPGTFTFRDHDRRDDSHVAFREEDDEEAVPETLRSSVFVRLHEPVSRPIIVDEVAPRRGYLPPTDDGFESVVHRRARDEDTFSAAAADTPVYFGVAAEDHHRAEGDRAEGDHRAA